MTRDEPLEQERSLQRLGIHERDYKVYNQTEMDTYRPVLKWHTLTEQMLNQNSPTAAMQMAVNSIGIGLRN